MMKVKIFSLLSLSLVVGVANAQKRTTDKNSIKANIDLVNVNDDKVQVEILPPAIKAKNLTFRFARIIPGTYAIADYGRYIDSVAAFDKKGNKLPLSRPNPNQVDISDATKLSRITYWVNDTYDTEKGGDVFDNKENQIFSPAGTNILAGKQYMLNLSGFLGYFDGHANTPYVIDIRKPENLYGTTALVDEDTSAGSDRYRAASYAAAVDNPIMYAEADTAGFNVDGMQVILGVYAPHKNVSAKQLLPDVEKTIRAQKKFLGKLNTTRKYAILAYLTNMTADDAKGIGALEHNNSTSAVFMSNVSSSDLVHVIGHEFFHTVTPLKIHSEQIQDFDFTEPKLSRHLWFYEGATEYFASLYQVNQHLIQENEFYNILSSKEETARTFSDTLSFTRMSQQVIDPQYKPQYPNVYMKGALLSMCIDIILREQSKGERGLLNLVADLAKTYGPEKAFPDKDFINIIGNMAGPEVARFLKDHVEDGKPVDYASYLARVGVVMSPAQLPEPIVFISHNESYLDIDDEKKQVLVHMADNRNVFLNSLGLKDKDVLLTINGLPMYENDGSMVILKGYQLNEGSPIVFEILRDGKPMTIRGSVKLNYAAGESYRAVKENQLRNSWLYR